MIKSITSGSKAEQNKMIIQSVLMQDCETQSKHLTECCRELVRYNTIGPKSHGLAHGILVLGSVLRGKYPPGVNAAFEMKSYISFYSYSEVRAGASVSVTHKETVAAAASHLLGDADLGVGQDVSLGQSGQLDGVPTQLGSPFQPFF